MSGFIAASGRVKKPDFETHLEHSAQSRGLSFCNSMAINLMRRKIGTAMTGQARLVELIGPAGSGKSTVGRVLNESGWVKVEKAPPYYRRVKDAPFFIKNTFLSLPTLMQLRRNLEKGDQLTAHQVAWLVTLRGWHRLLERKRRCDGPAVVLDEGPLFHLAYMYVYGPDIIRNQPANRWWESCYRRFGAILDMVIWLDGPNEVLVDRIRARASRHGVKQKSDADAFQYIEDLRASYERVMAHLLEVRPHLPVLRFNTADQSPEVIADQVLAQLAPTPRHTLDRAK